MDIITRTENGTYHVEMRGKFTFADNSEFRLIIDKLADPAIRQVVFHMDHVEFVDSAALGMFLLAHDEALKSKKALLLKGVKGQVKRTFEMARFEQFFNFH